MAIYFIEHAEERLIERGVPARKIKEMLKTGVIIEDICQMPDRKICIYKEGSTYYSIVFQPYGSHIFIITAYPSKEWEKKMYKEIKNEMH